MLEIIQIPVLNDNYIYLIHEPDSDKTAVIDPAISEPVIEILESKNWSLDYILNTHHHSDHIGGNLALKKRYHCKIYASESDSHRIPGLDKGLKEGDTFALGNETIHTIYTPGHTFGHIVYHFPDSLLVFCGDTLFSLGCGRLFEGSAEQMWRSLQKLKQLPESSKFYPAHEYTLANARFAMTLEADNPALVKKLADVEQLRKENKSTLPTTLTEELACNPFLREDSPSIRQNLKMSDSDSIEVFAAIRKLKDLF